MSEQAYRRIQQTAIALVLALVGADAGQDLLGGGAPTPPIENSFWSSWTKPTSALTTSPPNWRRWPRPRPAWPPRLKPT